MGTSGFKVYRYRRIYRTGTQSSDSYPSGLGWEIASSIPQDPAEFSSWVERMRNEFDQAYEAWLDDGNELSDKDYPRWEEDFFSSVPPNPGHVEWTYTIDLNNLVFQIKHQPVFRLDHMPERMEDFLKWMGHDNYGMRCYAFDTPAAYRYEGILVKPPPILSASSEIVVEYSKLSPTVVDWKDMIPKTDLLIPETGLLISELAVAGTVQSNRDLVLDWRAKGPTETIHADERAFAHSLIAMCLKPKFLARPVLIGHKLRRWFRAGGGKDDVWWATDHICVHLCGQLLNDDILIQPILTIVNAIKARAGKQSAFGIIFSAIHVVLIHVDFQGDELVIRRTSLLPFIPSHFAASPSTHGISAISSLCSFVFRECAFRYIQRYRKYYRGSPLAPPVYHIPDPETLPFHGLPNEVLFQILRYIDYDTLCTFGMASNRAFDLVLPFLANPSFGTMFQGDVGGHNPRPDADTPDFRFNDDAVDEESEHPTRKGKAFALLTKARFPVNNTDMEGMVEEIQAKVIVPGSGLRSRDLFGEISHSLYLTNDWVFL